MHAINHVQLAPGYAHESFIQNIEDNTVKRNGLRSVRNTTHIYLFIYLYVYSFIYLTINISKLTATSKSCDEFYSWLLWNSQAATANIHHASWNKRCRFGASDRKHKEILEAQGRTRDVLVSLELTKWLQPDAQCAPFSDRGTSARLKWW